MLYFITVASLVILFLDSQLFRAVTNALVWVVVYTLASPIILYMILVLMFGSK
jgi:hypothetical protein